MVDKKIYISLIFFGYIFNYVQNLIGMRNLWDGVKYYAEVHQSKWNALIHTLFMPITIFGLYLLIPALIGLNSKNAKKFKDLVMCFYFGLYLRISVLIALFCVLWFHIPYLWSSHVYEILDSRMLRINLGLISSLFSS